MIDLENAFATAEAIDTRRRPVDPIDALALAHVLHALQPVLDAARDVRSARSRPLAFLESALQDLDCAIDTFNKKVKEP